MKVSLILPVYNEQLVLEEVLARYVKDLKQLKSAFPKVSYEIVAVNDGSNDASSEILNKYAALNKCIRVVNFDGRFGKQAAQIAGFEYAKGDVVILADVDLLNPEGILSTIFSRVVGEASNESEPKIQQNIVYGYREFIDGERHKQTFSEKMTNFATKVFGIDGNFVGKVNISAFSRDVVDVLKALPERNKYMRTMDRWVGFEIDTLIYASEYSKAEIEKKVQELKSRHSAYAVELAPRRDKVRENSETKLYSLAFLVCSFFALFMFIAGVISGKLDFAIIMLLGILYVALLMVSGMFYLRSVLLKRVGVIYYWGKKSFYNIKSILN